MASAESEAVDELACIPCAGIPRRLSEPIGFSSTAMMSRALGVAAVAASTVAEAW